MKNIKQLVLVLAVIVGTSSGVILRAQPSFNLIDGEPIYTQDQGMVIPSHVSVHHAGHGSSTGSKVKDQAEQ